MLGSVVQVHLSPPNKKTPAFAGVFCFAAGVALVVVREQLFQHPQRKHTHKNCRTDCCDISDEWHFFLLLVRLNTLTTKPSWTNPSRIYPYGKRFMNEQPARRGNHVGIGANWETSGVGSCYSELPTSLCLVSFFEQLHGDPHSKTNWEDCGSNRCYVRNNGH